MYSWIRALTQEMRRTTTTPPSGFGRAPHHYVRTVARTKHTHPRLRRTYTPAFARPSVANVCGVEEDGAAVVSTLESAFGPERVSWAPPHSLPTRSLGSCSCSQRIGGARPLSATPSGGRTAPGHELMGLQSLVSPGSSCLWLDTSLLDSRADAAHRQRHELCVLAGASRLPVPYSPNRLTGRTDCLFCLASESLLCKRASCPRRASSFCRACLALRFTSVTSSCHKF